MTRLVEKELEDSQLWLVTGLIAHSWYIECHDDIDDFLGGKWGAIVQTLSEYPGWKDGGHEGDCTKVPVGCNRCLLESWVDEAKQLIAKYAGVTLVALDRDPNSSNPKSN